MNKKNFILIILFIILSLIIKNNFNKIKVCLCVIAKNENKYLREFVEYYKSIGYDRIFLYDNNGINGEKFDEVINDYITNGFVKVIDFKKNGREIKPQILAYKDCYSRNSKLYDWLSFFDVDEYIDIHKKYKKIQDFFNDKIFEHCQNIKINWLLYMIIIYYIMKINLYKKELNFLDMIIN